MTTPLPPQDPREPDELLPGEAELAALYRQLPQGEPGPALDAAVLGAAAQALAADGTPPAVPVERRKAPRERGDWVHPKPVPTPVPAMAPAREARPRWLLGLGSAAVLVLAAGLVWRMRELPPTKPLPASAAAGSVAAAKAAPAAANMPPPPAPPPESPKSPPPRATAAAPPPSVAAGAREAAADGQLSAASHEERLADVSRTPADTAGQASRQAPAIAAKSAVAEAAASTPPTMAAPAPLAQEADAGAASNAGEAQELERIRQLFAQGHDDEAQQRLAAFRQAHPQWKLPPELQAKLPRP